MNKNGFMDIYPFATENVSGYFEKMDIKDKTVLTVGSSLDQAFNAITLGAKKVTLFDISPSTFEFFKIKKDIILSKDRKDLYKILTNKKELEGLLSVSSKEKVSLSKDILTEDQVYSINNYLENDEKYELLRNGLLNTDIEFINGDIFKMNESLNNRKYDRIIFSNILQYLEYYFKQEDGLEVLKRCFPMWVDHLNEQGILQLLYLYSFSYSDLFNDNHSISTYNLRKINSLLKGYKLDIEWINGICSNTQDAIVTYQKCR